MFARLLSVAVSAVTAMGLIVGAALAADMGTAAEAKAMLERAVGALKVDKAKALADFNSGAAGFKEKDLYVYCGGPDGNFTAHPSLMGKSLKTLMDKGTPPKPIGETLYKDAKEGVISEMTYTWASPADPAKTFMKEVYFTKVGDQICGVGYQKP
jgi:hypothetical protein